MRTVIAAAASAGLASGAVVLSVIAFLWREPDGVVGGENPAATRLLAVNLGVVVCVTAVLIGIGLGSLRGRDRGAAASLMAAAASIATAIALLGSVTDSAREEFAGPGQHPVIALATSAWIVMVVSSLVLLLGAARPESVEQRSDGRRFAMRAAAVAAPAGVIVALVIGLIGTLVGRVDFEQVVTAEPTTMPAYPTEVGTRVAYSVPASADAVVLPAGPGFVVADHRGAIVSYDGVTGSPRWRASWDAMGGSCYRVRSVGAGADSMVVAECRDRIVGFDAMTGSVRWQNARDWRLLGQGRLPSSGIPVVMGSSSERSLADSSIGLLDPANGEVRWSRKGSSCLDDSDVVGTERGLAVIDICSGESGAVRTFDATDGTESRIALPKSFGDRDGYRRSVTVMAVQGDSMLIYADLFPDEGLRKKFLRYLYWVDTTSGTVREWSADNVPARRYGYQSDDRVVRVPGAVINIASEFDDVVTLLNVNSGKTTTYQKVKLYLAPDDVPSDQAVAVVGDHRVSALGNPTISVDVRSLVVFGGRDGAAQYRDSPCDSSLGGVLPVPGATLVICPRRSDDGSEYGLRSTDIIGFR